MEILRLYLTLQKNVVYFINFRNLIYLVLSQFVLIYCDFSSFLVLSVICVYLFCVF